MTAETTEPIIVNLPYGKCESDSFRSAVQNQLDGADMRSSQSLVEDYTQYLLNYPTVYVVYAAEESKNPAQSQYRYRAYVGETNDIIRRTQQHLGTGLGARADWLEVAQAVADNPEAFWQYVISHPLFNKSLTLDVENRLMSYLLSTDSVVQLQNRRANPQGRYYTSDKFEGIFSQIWHTLHEENPVLFPTEQVVRDSALFKASPFHELSQEQKEAEEDILSEIVPILQQDDGTQGKSIPKLIFVHGLAGTGKTVLLSHLFYRIMTEVSSSAPVLEVLGEEVLDHSGESSDAQQGSMSAYLVVNQSEQVAVYDQIALKLGLQRESKEIVLKPNAFIARHSGKLGNGRPNLGTVTGKADVVLIDEAHLLMTQGYQAYSGRSQLYDIIRRARVVIAVFDPFQILQARQQLNSDLLKKVLGPIEGDGQIQTVPAGHMSDFRRAEFGPGLGLPKETVEVAHIRLKQQFRIAASDGIVEWLDNIISEGVIGTLPSDPGEVDKDGTCIREPYEIRVFDSPVDLFKAIKEKDCEGTDGWRGRGLSRILATYDWKYTEGSPNTDDPLGYWNVSLYRDGDRWIPLQAGDAEMAEVRARLCKKADRAKRDKQVGVLSDEFFCKPWNNQIREIVPRNQRVDGNKAWAEKRHTIDEIGSTFTIQGFDLNFAGLIIGPSVKYRDGKIKFDRDASANYLATNRRHEGKNSHDFSETNLRNELNVLLKRGVHGLYLFAVDPALQAKLKEAVGNIAD